MILIILFVKKQPKLLKMKILEKEIKKNGFVYLQIHRSKDSAIYSQHDNGKIIAYEVFKIKIQQERLFKGRLMPLKEKFPHDEAFGYTAWTVRSEEKAFRIFNELEKNGRRVRGQKKTISLGSTRSLLNQKRA